MFYIFLFFGRDNLNFNFLLSSFLLSPNVQRRLPPFPRLPGLGPPAGTPKVFIFVFF